MYKRFYFTCFADHCLHYEEIREIIVHAEPCFTGGTAYRIPELWCDGNVEAILPHKCIGPVSSKDELLLRIQRRHIHNSVY